MKTRLKDLIDYARVHEMESEERERFLVNVSRDHPKLRVELERMLEDAEQADAFFDYGNEAAVVKSELEGSSGEIFNSSGAHYGGETSNGPLPSITESLAVITPIALVHPDEERRKKEQADVAPVAIVPESEGAEEQELYLIVGEGEAIKGQDRESDAKDKISSLFVACLVHIMVILLLAAIIVAPPGRNPPRLIATAISSTEDDLIDQQVIKKRIQTKLPPQASAAKLNITNVLAASPVALPDIDTDSLSLNAIGVGNTFGTSMSLTDSDGAGMVSFFGSRSKAQRVVFVVDSSASMNAKNKGGNKSKHKLMKEELIKTLAALPPTVEFQIIFFSGPAWFVGEKAPNPRSKEDDWHQWEGKNFWHYKDGEPDQLPVGKYIKATPSKVRKVIKQIEETPATYGTDWRAPLKMAMVMEPDIIYFMTDGAVGKHPKKEPVVKDVIAFNKKISRAKINAICLMVPKATDMLAQLSKDSRGDFTLVKEDGTIVRGKDVVGMK